MYCQTQHDAELHAKTWPKNRRCLAELRISSLCISAAGYKLQRQSQARPNNVCKQVAKEKHALTAVNANRTVTFRRLRHSILRSSEVSRPHLHSQQAARYRQLAACSQPYLGLQLPRAFPHLVAPCSSFQWAFAQQPGRPLPPGWLPRPGWTLYFPPGSDPVQKELPSPLKAPAAGPTDCPYLPQTAPAQPSSLAPAACFALAGWHAREACAGGPAWPGDVPRAWESVARCSWASG